MPDEIDMPWTPRTRQQQGAQTEQDIVKSMGGRVHPRSGAGRIKDDGSTQEEIIEVKDAMHSHTLSGDVLNDLYKRAVRQDKEPVYVVRFRGANITATIHLRKGT